MKRAFVASALFAIAFPLGACQHDVATPFPIGLEPLESDAVPPPGPTSANPYPETLDLVQGSDDTSDFVHATAYVDASIGDVWAAMKDPSVVVDRHNVTSYVVEWNVEAGYDVSFRTDYVVDGIETVSFNLTWREGVVGGSDGAPTGVSVVYEKTFGSSFITMMKGSIELQSIAPGVTEMQFAQRMDATDTSSDDIAKWTRGMFASVVARVHGQPLP